MKPSLAGLRTLANIMSVSCCSFRLWFAALNTLDLAEDSVTLDYASIEALFASTNVAVVYVGAAF